MNKTIGSGIYGCDTIDSSSSVNEYKAQGPTKRRNVAQAQAIVPITRSEDEALR